MKSFEQIIGQERVISHFEEAIQNGTISHAYLLDGESGTGKMMMAKAVAKALLCENRTGCGSCSSCIQVDTNNHPDLIYVTHEKYEIRVDDIRDTVNATIYTKPYSSDYKIYIIKDAEHMNIGAQNALLKTLEEPPAYAVIFLLANNKERLLDTILSRCVCMSMGAIPQDKIKEYLEANTNANDQMIDFAAGFSLGNLGKAIQIAESEQFANMLEESLRIVTMMKDMEVYEVLSYLKTLTTYKNEIYDFLDILTVWYRDILMLKTTGSLNMLIFKDQYVKMREEEIYLSFEGISHILDEIAKARVRLDANVNFDVTMEMLLLTIKENGRTW